MHNSENRFDHRLTGLTQPFSWTSGKSKHLEAISRVLPLPNFSRKIEGDSASRVPEGLNDFQNMFYKLVEITFPPKWVSVQSVLP